MPTNTKSIKNKSAVKSSRHLKNFISFLEILTTIAIVLVVAQTLMEDLSLFMGWSPTVIFIIKLTAVGFDIFFTIEFIVRMSSAIRKKEGKIYFLKRRGWIDLIASIPLLLLVSGPYLLKVTIGVSLAGLIAGTAGASRALKIIKAIKVTRVLRFIRMLKIFGKIKNVQSQMAQRHITRLCTIAVFSLTFFFIGFALVESTGWIPSTSKLLMSEEKNMVSQIKNADQFMGQLSKNEFFKSLISENPNVLYFSTEKEVLKDCITSDHYQAVPGKPPLRKISTINKRETDEIIEYKFNSEKGDSYTLYFSRSQDLKQTALTGIVNFTLILFMVLIILIFYSPHFARTITDPIFVMQKGFEKRDYTLMVKIPKKYEDDDIYQLANNFNNRWLPAKMRRLNSAPQLKPKLTLDDILKGPGLNDLDS